MVRASQISLDIANFGLTVKAFIKRSQSQIFFEMFMCELSRFMGLSKRNGGAIERRCEYNTFWSSLALLRRRSTFRQAANTFDSVINFPQPNYVPTLEDQIEAERQKKVEELKKSGKGTPVTPETFAEWQERKRKRKAEEAKKLVEAELRKKKGGKGLAVLTGRALYEYKQELFNVNEDTKEEEDESTEGDADNDQNNTSNDVEKVAEKVQTDLFLEGDDDLDDLDDLDDD
jgi:hypothetical protein